MFGQPFFPGQGLGGKHGLRVVRAVSGPQNCTAAGSCSLSRPGGLGSSHWLAVFPIPPSKNCQGAEDTHIQAAQNAGSSSPCPTGAPTLGATNPGLQSLCIWKPPKSSKHVPMSPPHSRHAWQLTDDHPKEAKGCLDRNFRSGIKVRVSLRSRRHQRVSSQ